MHIAFVYRRLIRICFFFSFFLVLFINTCVVLVKELNVVIFQGVIHLLLCMWNAVRS
jgi:hypothetical protein